MASRLKLFAKEWQSLTSDPFILETVQHSHMDFIGGQLPVQSFEPYAIKFNGVERKIIDGEIAKLLMKGVIVRCSELDKQFVSNIFIRQKKDGSYRMILNLSKVNLAVQYQKFKM